MSSQIELWVIEDDPGCHFVYENIFKNSYRFKFFESLNEFNVSLLSEKNPQGLVVIADLFLEDGNFIEFLSSNNILKDKNVPFMVVSSSEEENDLRKCFELGAFDYLTKPFKKAELIVKLENVIKRKVGFQPNPKEVLLDGMIVSNLTLKQVKLLRLFIQNSDRIVKRDEILTQVWGDTMVHPKTIDVHLYNLRRKLQPYGYMIKSEGGGKWSLLQQRINRR